MMFEKILECRNPGEILEMFDYDMDYLAAYAYAMAHESKQLMNELNDLTSQVVENESAFKEDEIALFISQYFID